MRRYFMGALGVVGALALAGGVAYATVPDGNGVIHGCYNTNPTRGPLGTLRVVDTGQGQACGTNESPVAWSQTGPKGTTGSQGPQGPKGATGAIGPSDGANTGTGSNSVTVPAGGEATVGFATGTLPAGDYLYTASLYVEPNGGSVTAACFAVGTGQGWGASGVGNTDVSTPEWIPDVGTLDLPSAQSAVISCDETGGVNSYKVHGAVNLVRVGALH
jgi:hypothetical protein